MTSRPIDTKATGLTPAWTVQGLSAFTAKTSLFATRMAGLDGAARAATGSKTGSRIAAKLTDVSRKWTTIVPG